MTTFADHELEKENIKPSKSVEKGKLQKCQNVSPRKSLKEAKYNQIQGKIHQTAKELSMTLFHLPVVLTSSMITMRTRAI